jgi:succinoglycan biosynthesis transport protein ExoP
MPGKEITTSRSELVSLKPRVLSRPGASVPMQPAPGDLRKAAEILGRHWRAAVIFLVTSVALVTVATLLMPPVYEAQGRLQIDPPGQEAFSLQSMPGETTDAEYINTEAQKLQTYELALAAVDALHLDQPSAAGANESDKNAVLQKAVAQFRKHLSIARDPGSRLVAVRFSSGAPQFSARAANTLMKLFIERSFQSRHDAITESSLWLTKQLDDIRSKMDQSYRDLTEFQQRHRIVEMEEGSTTRSQQLAELNKELAGAESQRMLLEAQTLHLTESGPSPQVSGNPVVQALRQKRAEISAELAKASVIYGPNHPAIRTLQNQLAEIDRQQQEQISGIHSEQKVAYAAALNREGLLR